VHEILSVVEGDYKLIAHQPSGRTELYDMRADPGERDDLSGARPEIEGRLMARVMEQQARARETGVRSSAPLELDPEMIDALEALGYGEEGVNTGEAPGDAE
jgi:hypothetical protein